VADPLQGDAATAALSSPYEACLTGEI
jgi:hypothetical protein